MVFKLIYPPIKMVLSQFHEMSWWYRGVFSVGVESAATQSIIKKSQR